MLHETKYLFRHLTFINTTRKVVRSCHLFHSSRSALTWFRFQHSTTSNSSILDEVKNNTDLLFQLNEETNSGTITFNRPQAANALGCEMLSQLQDAIVHLNSDAAKNIRCVILKSCSNKVFSAGADLRERSKMTKKEASEFVSSLRGTFNDLASLPMPAIACVEGAALGGGLEIALASDIIVAGKNATFGLPETSLAIIPGAGGTQRLPRLIGNARAKDMIFRANKIDADTAYHYGLVQYLVDVGQAEDKALEIASDMAKNGPLALRAAKKSINQGSEISSISDAMEVERKYYQSIIPTEDRLEGLAAFKEKRKPVYKGS